MIEEVGIPGKVDDGWMIGEAPTRAGHDQTSVRLRRLAESAMRALLKPTQGPVADVPVE